MNGPTAAGVPAPDITLLLVVHHEEGLIRDCLESCRHLVDEIVVVHDGPCRDRTLDIALEYTDRVVACTTNTGSAEFVRPYGLSLCRGDWVLVLDADERLSTELQRQLRGLVDADDVDSYGFAWPYVDADDNPVSRRSVSGKRFLFRRSAMYTVGLPHMTPDTYGRNVSRRDLRVLHQMKFAAPKDQFKRMLRQNRLRGARIAERLSGGPGAIETYHADLNDPRVKNARKLAWFVHYPLLALVTVPAWAFVLAYFGRGYWRAGWIGLHDALNIPVCHFWTCLYRLSPMSKLRR